MQVEQEDECLRSRSRDRDRDFDPELAVYSYHIVVIIRVITWLIRQMLAVQFTWEPLDESVSAMVIYRHIYIYIESGISRPNIHQELA